MPLRPPDSGLPATRTDLEIALLERALPALPGPSAPRPAAEGRGLHVLVVDDDADLRAYVRAALEPFYRITEAGNGADAFGKAARLRPALVITDAVMPLAGGEALCRALRADARLRATPILAISGERGAVAGADAYLPKPFTRTQLLQALQRLLGTAS